MLSRGELRGRVLRFLNKTSAQTGFYSEDKVNDAIGEAMDYVATHMFMAGEGWLVNITYKTTAAGQVSVPLPFDTALIRELRYKVGDTYFPLTYDDQDGGASALGSGVSQQFASRYRLVGSIIVFDPPLADGGTDFLQIESVRYPATLKTESDMIDPQFDRAMVHYIKYKVCSILAGSLEKDMRTWAQEEYEWYEAMLQVVTRRNLKSTAIGEYL